ncbi:MAG: PAS domain-containing sensor histidine kinase [Aggregatilineales bacterium]
MNELPISDEVVEALQQLAVTKDVDINQLLHEMIVAYPVKTPSAHHYATDENPHVIQMYKGLFERNNDAITIISLNDYIIRAVNQRAVQIFGFENVEEMIGTSAVSPHMPPSERKAAQEMAFDIAQGKQPELYERIFQRKDGSTFIGEVNIALVYDKNGTPLHYQSIIRDVTLRRKLNDSIAAALKHEQELNELRTYIIQGLSHEFRTPMTIIKTSGQLLGRYFDKLDEVKRHTQLNRINENIDRLTHIIESMMLVDQLQFGTLTADVSVRDIVRYMHQTIYQLSEHQQLTHEINFISSVQEYEARLDYMALSIILRELLNNAIKYTPDDDKKIELELYCFADHIKFEIRDNGRGIPQQDQKHIFDYFYRGTNIISIPGAGLGLTLVKLAVASHKGDIKIDSTEGTGTTVYVKLPVLHKTYTRPEGLNTIA